MTPPVRPEPADPLEELKALRAQSDPLDELKALRPKRDIHAEFRSGALAKKNARLNQNDVEMAEAESPSLSTLVPGALANAAQGIPGMELAQAGARSLVRGQPYKDALSDVRGTTDQIPGAVKLGQRVAGAVPLAAVLPAGAAASGAIVGGAEGVLGADADQTLGDRAIKGTVGAAGGALLGKGTEMLTTAGRALASTAPAKKLADLIAERTASSNPLFAKALAQGQGRTGTPAIRAYLNKPDIREIVEELQQTRKFANAADDSPEVLDAVYKVLSDRGAQVKRGLDAVTPNRPNIGRFRGEDIRAAKDEALHAMSGGTSLPGPMPAYREAVENFAEKSGGIEALRRGNDALRFKLGASIPTGKNLDRTTREALEKWASSQSPTNRGLASDGILGAIKEGAQITKPIKSTRALSEAPDLLRAVGSPKQPFYDLLSQLGILTADNAIK